MSLVAGKQHLNILKSKIMKEIHAPYFALWTCQKKMFFFSMVHTYHCDHVHSFVQYRLLCEMFMGAVILSSHAYP